MHLTQLTPIHLFSSFLERKSHTFWHKEQNKLTSLGHVIKHLTLQSNKTPYIFSAKKNENWIYTTTMSLLFRWLSRTVVLPYWDIVIQQNHEKYSKIWTYIVQISLQIKIVYMEFVKTRAACNWQPGHYYICCWPQMSAFILLKNSKKYLLKVVYRYLSPSI